MSDKFRLSFNSAMLYIVAFLLTTILHELFHAIAGWCLGSSPELHHNFVYHRSTEGLSVMEKSIIALAGPAISFVQGVFFGSVFLKSKSGTNGLKNLLFLWLSVLGLFNFFGYWMTGVLFKKGDVGKFYELAETPLWLQISFAILASLFLLLIAYRLTAAFLSFSYRKEWTSTGTQRKKFNFHALILPWIIGSVVITLLYLPVVALVSIIYPVTSGMIFIFPWQNADSIHNSQNRGKSELGKVSWAIGLILLFLMLVFKFILAPGIRF